MTTTALEKTTGWTEQQIEVLKQKLCPGMSNEDLILFEMQCRKTGLDPFTGQIHAIMRRTRNRETEQWESRMTTCTGIDGFRLIAERSGKYAGQDAYEFAGPNGKWTQLWTESFPPTAARASVHRKDFSVPMVVVALWKEYAQYYKAKPTGLWGSKPCVMLGKCAEMQAIRRAFPNELSGIYGAEELGDLEPKNVTPAENRAPAAEPKPKKTVEERVMDGLHKIGISDDDQERILTRFNGPTEECLNWMRGIAKKAGNDLSSIHSQMLIDMETTPVTPETPDDKPAGEDVI